MVIAQVFYDSESSSVQNRAWCQALRATGGPPDPIAGRILSSRPARHGPSQAYAKFTCIERNAIAPVIRKETAALESHFHSTLDVVGDVVAGSYTAIFPEPLYRLKPIQSNELFGIALAIK